MRERYPAGQYKETCSKCSGKLEEHLIGRSRYCLKCKAKYSRETRVKHSDLSPEQRLKANARAYLNTYVSRGKIVRQPCEVCGEKKSEAHHKDYSKPLEVIWLCREHHFENHHMRVIGKQSKQRGLSFNTLMTRQIMRGLKTETRRTRGLTKINRNPDEWELTGYAIRPKLRATYALFRNKNTRLVYEFKCPFGVVANEMLKMDADQLYVQEWFSAERVYPNAPVGHENFNESRFIYKVDKAEHVAKLMKWSPGMFMPKQAARTFLDIVELKAERLHSITEAGAIAEGIEPDVTGLTGPEPGIQLYYNYAEEGYRYIKALESFRSLWNSITGACPYDLNPWVWVIKFRQQKIVSN